MTAKIVEVSQDALGWLLVYARAHDGRREGEPVGAPHYYKSRTAAAKAAKAINGPTPDVALKTYARPKKTYTVTLPIAGHLVIEVEAENAEAAIQAALVSDQLTSDNIETWEALEQFHQGNVCYCPSPWKAEAVPAPGEEPDADEDED